MFGKRIFYTLVRERSMPSIWPSIFANKNLKVKFSVQMASRITGRANVFDALYTLYYSI